MSKQNLNKTIWLDGGNWAMEMSYGSMAKLSNFINNIPRPDNIPAISEKHQDANSGKNYYTPVFTFPESLEYIYNASFPVLFKNLQEKKNAVIGNAVSKDVNINISAIVLPQGMKATANVRLFPSWEISCEINLRRDVTIEDFNLLNESSLNDLIVSVKFAKYLRDF